MTMVMNYKQKGEVQHTEPLKMRMGLMRFLHRTRDKEVTIVTKQNMNRST